MDNKSENFNLPDLDELSSLFGDKKENTDSKNKVEPKKETNDDSLAKNNIELNVNEKSSNNAEVKGKIESVVVNESKNDIETNNKTSNISDSNKNDDNRNNLEEKKNTEPNITASNINSKNSNIPEIKNNVETKKELESKVKTDSEYNTKSQAIIEKEVKDNTESKKDTKSVNNEQPKKTENKKDNKANNQVIKKELSSSKTKTFSKSNVQHRPAAKQPSIYKPKKKKKSSCFKVFFILFFSFAVIGALSGYIVYKGYESYNLFEKTRKAVFHTPEELKSVLPEFLVHTKHDDENFPSYAKKFMPNPKLYEEISKIDTLVPRGKDLGNHFMEEKLYENLNTIIPENINDFKTQFIPAIKAKMNETKNQDRLSYNERKDMPDSPNTSAYRNSIRYWNLLSRYYDKKRDYDTSLLLIHSIFYVSNDLLNNYSSSGFFSARVIYLISNSLACDSILNWASKPRLNSQKLAKLVAKDILEFVDKQPKLSDNLKFEKEYFDNYMKIFFEKYENGIFAYVEETQEYKELLDFLYKEPEKFIDKPLYEIKKQLDEMNKKLDELYLQNDVSAFKSTSFLLKTIFKPEPFIIKHMVLLYYPNYRRLKVNNEETLAKMEFCAIALAINSFYCEKGRLPSSIGELSNWFGQEFPNNRLTNKPYKLDFEGSHLMYNEKGIVENEYFFDLAR